MVAPKAETVFTVNRNVVGIVLTCPDCEAVTTMLMNAPLRVETPADWAPGECPDEVGQAGPLGFVARCDACGFRVHLRGDRLPTTTMIEMARQEADRG